ncbi:archaemetzincin-2-like isoform X1 [Haliotis rufescens]|uniref:archaemetzincin-2-like isoform X1 n=1 Tax=Haliotis rufescens TaxID=6454 RepID=UPI00201F7FF7|nr:archaemetzincin-2-like isoform X1 [Haliotis rufescens]
MANFTRMSDDMLIDAIGLVVKMDDGTKRGRFGSYELKYEEHYVLRSQNTQSLLKFFIPDVKSFQAMNQPSSSDWLSYHKESEQTFYDFLASTHYTPDCVRHRIYIQPFSIDEEQVPPGILTAVQSYTNIFFGMDVEVLTPISLKGDVPERVNAYSRTLQVDALVVLSRLVKLVRKDAFCVAGITLCDLYPEEDWNFVFGVASCAARCGVHSLARYLDNFGMQKTSVFDNRGDSMLLVRACKTLCHEMGHMFGLSHCVHFKCLMNGANHLQELDSLPVFLCPVCLRKLHYSCDFAMSQRYEKMLDFWTSCSAQDEVCWLRRRISFLED